MPTTKRAVIRSYDRALQILRDEGGVIYRGRRGVMRISSNGRTYTLWPDVFNQLADNHQIVRDNSWDDWRCVKLSEAQAAKDADAKREAEQAAERQRREDARVKEIAEALEKEIRDGDDADGAATNIIIKMRCCDAKDKLLAILSDVAVNGI